MEKDKDILVNPWLVKAQDLVPPDDVVFICAYDLDIGPDYIPEALFFHRTDGSDELWCAVSPGSHAMNSIGTGILSLHEARRDAHFRIGCAYIVEQEDTERVAAVRLLDRLIRARRNFNGLGKFLMAGMIDDHEFQKIVRSIEDDVRMIIAHAKESAIIEVARELGLNPQPEGDQVDHWYARCPNRNHSLYITASHNSFGCGWCQRRGGIAELRALVTEPKR